MQTILIDLVPYEVSTDKDNLTGTWFSVNNFVGMDGTKVFSYFGKISCTF